VNGDQRKAPAGRSNDLTEVIQSKPWLDGSAVAPALQCGRLESRIGLHSQLADVSAAEDLKAIESDCIIVGSGKSDALIPESLAS
jgi:hypothetical protein